MNNPEQYPHATTHTQLATEYNLEPADIACAERAFGNDFEAMQFALEAIEPLSLDEILS